MPRMRDSIGAVRAIWRCWNEGVPLDFRGEFYTHTLMTPFFNPGGNAYGFPPIALAGFVLANVFLMTVIGAIAFVGLDWVAGLLWFMGKTYAFVFLFVWMRGTLPRVRVDQLMDFAWKWLLPAALLNLFVTAVALVILNSAGVKA